MAIKAVGFRITIRADKVVDSDAEKTKALAEKAGIALPDKVADDLTNEATREQASVDQGVVLGIGDEAFKAYGGSPWCQVGDYIAYARHAGKWVKDPDTKENILIINDEDVVCVITKNEVAKDD